MSSRSKEKVAAAFRKLFRSSDKIDQEAGIYATGSANGNGQGSGIGSPSQSARRLLRHGYRDPSKVSPADNNGPLGSPTPLSKNKHPGSGLFKSKKGNSSSLLSEASAKHSKTVRTRRLMKEFREIQKQQMESDNPVFTVELVNDNLYEWHVRLYRIDTDSDLYKDMKELEVPYILLNLNFPDNFPFAPPFMGVISPRIEKGFVMEGGAICMELLTPRGWASAYTVEAVIMQFAASIVKGQGRIAKKHKGSKEFSKRSAEESFRSLVKTHEKYGWVTPPLADG